MKRTLGRLGWRALPLLGCLLIGEAGAQQGVFYAPVEFTGGYSGPAQLSFDYTTCDGSRWTAQPNGRGPNTSTLPGAWVHSPANGGPSHSSDRIDFVRPDGVCVSATLVNLAVSDSEPPQHIYQQRIVRWDPARKTAFPAGPMIATQTLVVPDFAKVNRYIQGTEIYSEFISTGGSVPGGASQAIEMKVRFLRQRQMDDGFPPCDSR